MLLVLWTQLSFAASKFAEVYAPLYVETRYRGEVIVRFDETQVPLEPAGQRSDGVAKLHTVLANDTLGSISQQHFGTTARWIDIFKANEDTIADPDKIFVGRQIRIPGTANVAPTENSGLPEFFAAAEPVLIALQRAVDKETVQLLRGKVTNLVGQVVLSATELRAAGLSAVFDPATLDLKIGVPPEARKSRIHNLGYENEQFDGAPLVEPESVSGYLNLFGRKEFDYETREGSAATLSFDSALNVKSYVLEGGGTFTDAPGDSFSRQDIRLVKDFPDKMIRSSVGDLAYPISYYQNFQAMGGLSITRNFTLQPYRNVVPAQSKAIFLRTPSVVTVIQNGQRLKSFDLPAGNHVLENLPSSPGISVIVLEIRDEAGRIEYVQMAQSLTGLQLKQGLHQFSYNAGYKSSVEHGDYVYDSDDPFVSMWHRYGVLNALTAGAAVEHDHRHSTSSVEALYSTFVGTFGLNSGFSRSRDYGSDQAQRITYAIEDFRESNKYNRYFSAAIERTGGNFVLAGGNPDNSTDYALSLNYSQKIIWEVTGGASYSKKWESQLADGLVDPYSFGLTFSKGLDNNMTFNLNLLRRHDTFGRNNDEVQFLFSWNFDDYQSTNLRFSSNDSSTEGTYRYNRPTSGASRYDAAATVRHAPDNHRATASLNYTGNRGRLDISHTGDKIDGETLTQQTSAGFATGIAFAGRKVGWGQPINDSFGVVTRPRQWLDQNFGVNPRSNDRFEAEVNGLGPALLPTLASYQFAQVYFDNTAIKEGYQFDPSTYTLLPTYKSGFLMQPGTDSTVTGVGSFASLTGPLALLTGHFVGENGTAHEFFTNPTGRFVVEGLNPGTYTVRLKNRQWRELKVQIPYDTRGVYKLGDIILEPREN